MTVNAYNFDKSLCPVISGGYERKGGPEHISVQSVDSKVNIRDHGVEFVVDGQPHQIDRDNAYVGFCLKNMLVVRIRSRTGQQAPDEMMIFYAPNPSRLHQGEIIRGTLENKRQTDLAAYKPETVS